MKGKLIKVKDYVRSPRGETPYKDGYPKPGPKTEKVKGYIRKG